MSSRYRVTTTPSTDAEGLFCAPGVRKGQGTCFDHAGLIRAIEDYNKKYPTGKIRYNKSQSNQELWQLLRDHNASVCGDQEWCWLDQEFLKNDSIIQSYYKPPKPSRQHKWLSTSDIDRVLKQYEREHPEFLFMGAVPLDFETEIDEFKNLHFCGFYNGKEQTAGGRPIRRFGCVFNMDPHDKKGSHWVCMFLNLVGRDKFIGFFDSYGQPPPPEIDRFIRRLQQQVKTCLGFNIKYKCNTVRHQHKGTECGVYCLYFIYQCLQGHSFEAITETIILDDAVNKFRDFFYRPTVNYKPTD